MNTTTTTTAKEAFQTKVFVSIASFAGFVMLVVREMASCLVAMHSLEPVGKRAVALSSQRDGGKDEESGSDDDNDNRAFGHGPECVNGSEDSLRGRR